MTYDIPPWMPDSDYWKYSGPDDEDEDEDDDDM